MADRGTHVAHRLYARLYALVGKDGAIDPDIPAGALVGSMVQRAVWLARGAARFRRPVFVGPQVRVRGRRSLHLGRAATLEGGCRVDAVSADGVWLGDRAKLGAGTVVSTTSHVSRRGVGLRLGRDSSCGEWCFFGASGGITIGDEVIMGQLVTFHAQEHNVDEIDVPIRRQGVSETGIVIGDGTWIGAKATFLDGARVGANTVVAAGAVVKGEHPPGAVLAGVPARVVRQR
jgi:acetyltransferase-like isoleucine patch superfamily enzyme